MSLGLLHGVAGEEVFQRGGHLQHNVLDAADPSIRDQGPRLVGPVLEVPAVGDDHLFARGVRSGHQVSGIGGCGRQRLFHQQVAAFRQCSDSVLVMQHVRRRDHHAVHRDLVQHGAIILEAERDLEFALQLGEFRRPEAIDRDDLAILVRSQHRQMVDRRPPTGANHADARLPRHSAPAFAR